jgi:phosphoenolpyruvate carboxykinase (GTP)
VYRVNWFNRGDDGKFLWPGFGENLRVLQWVIDRCRGRAKGVETPIGHLPRREELNVDGLSLADGALDRLLAIDREGWVEALRSQSEFFARFGTRLPKEMMQEHDHLKERIEAKGAPVTAHR